MPTSYITLKRGIKKSPRFFTKKYGSDWLRAPPIKKQKKTRLAHARAIQIQNLERMKVRYIRRDRGLILLDQF